jgi:hypothetical protein
LKEAFLETKTEDKIENYSDEADGGKMSKSTFTIEAKKSKTSSKLMSTGSYTKNVSENQQDILQIEKSTKGQLISKCPFGVFKSPKKPMKFFPGFLP